MRVLEGAWGIVSQEDSSRRMEAREHLFSKNQTEVKKDSFERKGYSCTGGKPSGPQECASCDKHQTQMHWESTMCVYKGHGYTTRPVSGSHSAPIHTYVFWRPSSNTGVAGKQRQQMWGSWSPRGKSGIPEDAVTESCRL